MIKCSIQKSLLEIYLKYFEPILTNHIEWNLIKAQPKFSILRLYLIIDVNLIKCSIQKSLLEIYLKYFEPILKNHIEWNLIKAQPKFSILSLYQIIVVKQICTNFQLFLNFPTEGEVLEFLFNIILIIQQKATKLEPR